MSAKTLTPDFAETTSCHTEADRRACLRKLPTTYGEVALTLVDNGWAPVPLVTDSKVPNRRNWPHRTALSSSDLRRVVEQELGWRGPTDRRGCAVGVVVPPTVLAIDSDRMDPSVQAVVWDRMLETFGEPDMVRVGRSPKFMTFYAAAPGIHSRKLPGLEVFCRSGQFAALGIHEVTHRPYAWSERNPLNTRPHELQTRVAPQQVDQFITRVAAAGVLLAARPRDFTTVVGKHPTQRPVFAATARLHELFAEFDGLVLPAVRTLIEEIGKAGHGRHNAIIALAGRVVLQNWTDQQALEFLTPLINEHFGDGDWTAEIEAALRHARGREAARLVNTKSATWPRAVR